MINLSTVNSKANKYWRSRQPITTAGRGECCMCPNDAVYYSNDGTGYCLGHWHGSELLPGMHCAEKMCRSIGTVKGGKFKHSDSKAILERNDLRIYWVTGTCIFDPSKLNRNAKPAPYGYINTYRPSTDRVSAVLTSNLLPIRKGMPKVTLSTFAEVYGV